MAYHQPDMISGEQYRYALTNFRIAHEKVEEQRVQLQEQEKQIALLRARIATLEGGSQGIKTKQGQSSVDDFSIKNSASKLERLINGWAVDVVRTHHHQLNSIRQAAVLDIYEGYPPEGEETMIGTATAMQVQNLLRHAVSQAISEGIVNCLIVTNSQEANIQLTRIHEHIFARKRSTFPFKFPGVTLSPSGDPTVASVWRRQTFSAAVETFTTEMSQLILDEHMPSLTKVLHLYPVADPASHQSSNSVTRVLEAAYDFSRMLHGSSSSAGGTVDAFYRAFVPELASTLYPRQIELVKRCLTSERGELDKVGATIFPGLVKVSRGPTTPNDKPDESNVVQTVVRRAQVICACALAMGGPGSVNGSIMGSPSPPISHSSHSHASVYGGITGSPAI
ncbi:hypothetical protein BDM02DRAFT_3186418 [Thelephora ganbajun]|uniref:Uncharacterized protein n=1 Tax=Thelephora ganbajun TaxID=370292 RepID=A0ACB6ZIK6_THEGA|nr:hypothetical protein BDM02DRAFT_3186418 [Thelephora ganbajun]